MMLTKKLYIGLFAGLLVVAQSAHAMIMPEPWHNDIFFQINKHRHSDENTKKTLHSAAQTDDLEAVRQLLTQKNINIDEQDDNGQTPLYLAVKNGHLKIVKLLIVHGANIHLPDKQGVYAREIAKQNKNLDIVTYLELMNDLFILHKNQMTFENFANTYLELKDRKAARENWEYTIEIVKSQGYKEIKKELYNWGIKKYWALDDDNQNSAQKFKATILENVPGYKSFFLLDNLSQIKTILIFKFASNYQGIKKMIEKMVDRHDSLIINKARYPLLNAYDAVLQKTYKTTDIKKISLTTIEQKTRGALQVQWEIDAPKNISAESLLFK